MSIPHSASLNALRESLDALRNRTLSIKDFCVIWRGQEALLAALPPQFGHVMEDALGRMEAGELFGEESCSFSPEDLRSSLVVWLDKAQLRLQEAR